MNPKTKIEELVQTVRRSTIPKEAEWGLQDFITELVRNKIDNQELLSFLEELRVKLIQERENETKTLRMINFNAAIDLVEDYQTLMQNPKK